jgi:hypothetical protein
VAPASRRATAAKPARTNGSLTSQEKQKGETRRAGGLGGLSTNQVIGIGAGTVALLAAGSLALPSHGESDKKPEAAKPAAAAAKKESEKTPYGELEKLAEESLARGERSAAVNYYSMAADRAEQDGNTTQARLYSMKAKDLMFTSKLKDQ